ncbi:MAG: trigger factor [Chloroflexi bacterium]|nr:trigger factor [Chloroflexota bacterium]
MKITQEEVVDQQTVLRIELEDSDLGPYLERGYKRLAPRTVISGFRKGKAPRRIVENFLGRESLINEVLDSMAPEVADRAIEERALDAFGPPRLEILDLDPFTLKATVPLTPDVDLSHYKTIRIEPEPAELGETDVEDRIEQMRNSQGTWDPVERAVAMGDMVTMDVLGTVGDRTIIDEKGAVYFLNEDSDRPLPGFAKKLVGSTTEAPAEFILAVPEDHADSTLAGEEVSFNVNVSEVKERNVPDLDDEFAKGVGDGYDDLASLRESVADELKQEGEERSANMHREAVVAALVDGMTLDLPLVTLQHEADHMEAERDSFLQRVNIRVDDYLQSRGKTEEESRSEMEEEAAQRLKRTFAISKVAELEGVDVSEEDIEGRIDSLKSGRDDREISASAVRQSLITEKAIDRLVSIAKGESVPQQQNEADGNGAVEPTEDDKEKGGDAGDSTA